LRLLGPPRADEHEREPDGGASAQAALGRTRVPAEMEAGPGGRPDAVAGRVGHDGGIARRPEGVVHLVQAEQGELVELAREVGSAGDDVRPPRRALHAVASEQSRDAPSLVLLRRLHRHLQVETRVDAVLHRSEGDVDDDAEVALEMRDLVVVFEHVPALHVDQIDVGPERERTLVPCAQPEVDAERAVADEGAEGVEMSTSGGATMITVGLASRATSAWVALWWRFSTVARMGLRS
jgi:hypothetical protein